MRHQLFDLPGHSFDVIDDQLIKIREVVFAVNDQMRANVLRRSVCVGIHDVCEIVSQL